MSDITADEDRIAETCAEHFAITTMMNVPDGIDPQTFVNLVTDKYRAKCDEKVKEVTRRASLQRQ